MKGAMSLNWVEQMSYNNSAASEQNFKISSGNMRPSVRASVIHACVHPLLPSTIPVQCLVRALRWVRRLMHGFRARPLGTVVIQ